ncbi:hypothetical protein [Proteiniphilum sp. UBA5384]|uniref:hypothetical protein n=1 Tax=Proteiniphilum sp. UBA5384 TaxID=1947279 RepID=UPI0025D02278|nr:hypothetical protein [Proteiniphilum sp. UBA5384]
MKKIYYYLILSILSVSCISNTKTFKNEDDRWAFVDKSLGLDRNDLGILDSIKNNTDNITLLTLIYDECDMCSLLLESEKYKNLPIEKIELDIAKNSAAKIISQALYTTGFPTSYLFNGRDQLHSILPGGKSFRTQIDSVLNDNQPIAEVKVPTVDINSTTKMFSFSLNSIYAIKERDFAKAKENLRQSLKEGSYFFNNYMLSLIYLTEERVDSTEYFQKRASWHANHGSSPYIYENLINNLNLNAMVRYKTK